MKWWSLGAAAVLAMASAPAWAQWQYREDFDLAEARVEAGGHRLAVVCEYDDWDDDVYEEIRLYPPDPGKEEDVDALNARKPRLTIRIDGWEWSEDVQAFFGSKRIYFWADANTALYERLAAAAGDIEASVTLSAPTQPLASQSFPSKDSRATIRRYGKECDNLW